MDNLTVEIVILVSLLLRVALLLMFSIYSFLLFKQVYNMKKIVRVAGNLVLQLLTFFQFFIGIILLIVFSFKVYSSVISLLEVL